MILGILLLVATGVSWVVTGAVIGHASKHGLPVGTIQACTAAVSILVSGTVLFCHPDPECAFPVRFWTIASIFGSGFFNYFVLQLMGKAMKNGPNGIVWAIVQSALVFPVSGRFHRFWSCIDPTANRRNSRHHHRPRPLRIRP